MLDTSLNIDNRMGFSRLQSIKSPNGTYQIYVLDVYNDLIEIPADIQTRAICVDDMRR